MIRSNVCIINIPHAYLFIILHFPNSKMTSIILLSVLLHLYIYIYIFISCRNGSTSNGSNTSTLPTPSQIPFFHRTNSDKTHERCLFGIKEKSWRVREEKLQEIEYVSFVGGKLYIFFENGYEEFILQ
jgi:hypothetical protein